MYSTMYIHVYTCLYNVYTCLYIVHTCMYIVYQFNMLGLAQVGRPTHILQLVVYALTSIFLSPLESSLLSNQRPPYPYLMELIPLQSG